MYTQFGYTTSLDTPSREGACPDYYTTCMELLNIFIPVEDGLYSRNRVTSINRNKSRAMSGERDNDPVFFFFPGGDSVLIE